MTTAPNDREVPAMTRPDFSTALPRQLVHRSSIAEVFLTAAARQDADTFELAAQIPRFHAFYHDTGSAPVEHDSMVFVEVLRQASIVIPHEFLAVPLGERFVWLSVELRVVDRSVLLIRDAPTEVIVACRVQRRYPGNNRLPGVLLRCAVELDGWQAVVADLNYCWASEQTWDRMRRANRAALDLPPEVGAPVPAPARIAPALVGRHNPYNVVISPMSPGADGSHTSGVVVDPSHPTLFDHPLDHVPGMLALEVFRQFAIALAAARDGLGPASTRSVLGLSARFTMFVELDLPCDCTGRETGLPSGVDHSAEELGVRCVLSQRGRALVRAEVQLAASTGPAGPPSLPGPSSPPQCPPCSPSAWGAEP